MTKRKPNQPIGTCSCPFRDCDQTVPVFRYRKATDDPAKQRHAGRLYLMCPTHGKSEDQEWILEHGNITGEDSQPDVAADLEDAAVSSPADENGTVSSPETHDQEPGKAKASPKTDKKNDKDTWGFFK